MKISWTDGVRNEEVLQRVSGEMNILHTIIRRMANWIGHILRRNYLLKDAVEGKIKGRIQVTGRRWQGRKQLLDEVRKKRSYCNLRKEVIVRTLWRIHLGRDYGPVADEITS